MSSHFLHLIGRRINDQAYAQGIGRHTKEENMMLAEGDIKAISNFLGNWVTDFECILFGWVTLWLIYGLR